MGSAMLSLLRKYIVVEGGVVGVSAVGFDEWEIWNDFVATFWMFCIEALEAVVCRSAYVLV